MSLPFAVPGSLNAVVEGLDLRAQLALRNELRRLRDETDAMLATLFVVDGGKTEVIEYAGDRAVLPTPLPRCLPTAPSMEAMRCGDLDEHLVVVGVVRIGRGWPVLGLAVVDPDVVPPALVDLVEAVGARLEAVLVRVLSGGR
jgi:hypothetical protein